MSASTVFNDPSMRSICQSAFVRHPHLRQEPGGIELRQYGGIDRVRLDLGMSDQPHLLGVGDDDPADRRCKQLGDRRGVAGSLDDPVVVMRELLPCKRGMPQSSLPIDLNLFRYPQWPARGVRPALSGIRPIDLLGFICLSMLGSSACW